MASCEDGFLVGTGAGAALMAAGAEDVEVGVTDVADSGVGVGAGRG